MKALGIDFGERRIGLAISDAEGRFALPLLTFERKDDRQAADRIAAIAREEEVELLVLGEPRGAGGVRGGAAERVGRFGQRLAELTGLTLELVDETLTTREAARRLSEAGVDLRRHPERLDAVAAQIVLEEGLARRQPRDPGSHS
ncbi:MAG TPA: Holliday junction resolvase RuvX [Thermoanaerobaculia bacterium]|nr:Holliday junction resolvase RuvX [Thermoanaerobaculia bacterium]